MGFDKEFINAFLDYYARIPSANEWVQLTKHKRKANTDDRRDYYFLIDELGYLPERAKTVYVAKNINDDSYRFVGNADEVAEEIGATASNVSHYAARGRTFDKQYTFQKMTINYEYFRNVVAPELYEKYNK